MKKLNLILIGIFIPVYLSAQDIIYKTNGTEIKAKVIEIKTDVIQYYNFGESKDTIKNIPLNDVFMIVYEGGTREVIKKKATTDSTIYNQNNAQYSIISKDKIAIVIVDKRENKVVIGKAPSKLARGVGLIVQPSTEIKDQNQKIYSYAIKTLKKILEVKGFSENGYSNCSMEVNFNELYYKAEVGLYGTGGTITQNCRCTIVLKSNNGILFNKDFFSSNSAKTKDFSNQEDLLYGQYYSINDKKELKSKKQIDIREYSDKGYFINFIIVLDDIINQVITDKEFQKILKI
jgi:hypothetical protein